MSAEFSVPCKKGKRVRVGYKPKERLWTPALVDLVWKTWGRELKLFGYNEGEILDGGKPSHDNGNALIPVGDMSGANVRYSREEDKLYVDDIEVVRGR